MSIYISTWIKRRLKKQTNVDKEKGQGVNVIVSVDKNGGNNGNGGEIKGYLRIDAQGCNGQSQGGNGYDECWESFTVIKDIEKSGNFIPFTPKPLLAAAQRPRRWGENFNALY